MSTSFTAEQVLELIEKARKDERTKVVHAALARLRSWPGDVQNHDEGEKTDQLLRVMQSEYERWIAELDPGR